MNKKILSVVLMFTMVIAMLSGCGKKDSTYIKEVKEITGITTGTYTAVIDVVVKTDESLGEAEFLKDKDGNAAFSLKMEGTAESETKAGVKFLVKLGQDSEYSELITCVVEDKKLYMTVDPLIAFIKKIDEATASQVEDMFTQMGISGAISMDLDKIFKALGTEYPTASEENKKAAYEFLTTLADAAEKNFKELEGQEGDDYTLKLNTENADKAIKGAADFLKNDAKGILEKIKTMVTDIYGADNEMTKSMTDSYDEIIEELPDTVKYLEDNKDEAVKAIKDNNINIISTAQFNGKTGSREGRLTLDTGKLVLDETSEMNFKMSYNIKEGKPEIKEMIPENASDITTMIVTMFNYAENPNGATGLY